MMAANELNAHTFLQVMWKNMHIYNSSDYLVILYYRHINILIFLEYICPSRAVQNVSVSIF